MLPAFYTARIDGNECLKNYQDMSQRGWAGSPNGLTTSPPRKIRAKIIAIYIFNNVKFFYSFKFIF